MSEVHPKPHSSLLPPQAGTHRSLESSECVTPGLKSNQYNTMEGEKFVSNDTVAKIKKKEAQIPGVEVPDS